MNYIATRPLKNKVVAALLVFVPFGLFYSSIWGGIVMYFIVPILTVFSVFKEVIPLSLIIIFVPVYILICLIWALVAVSEHNKAVLNNSLSYNSSSTIEQSTTDIPDDIQTKKSEVYKNLQTIKELYD